jgi:hypothetical protein
MADIQEKLDVLKKIGAALNREDISWAVGASLMLYFNHKTDDFHDIDLMVSEDDAEKCRQILLKMGTMLPPHPKRKYPTKQFMEFVIDSVDIDVMAGFAIADGEKVHDCSFHPDQIGAFIDLEGVSIPIQKMSLWRQYYQWMGRNAKVQMIDGDQHGKE